MRSLLYYKPSALAQQMHPSLPGTRALSAYLSLFDAGAIFCDRTHTIRSPLRMDSVLPMPAFRQMDRSFGDVCDERAREILDRADALDVPIFCMWSGGIDSTLVLVSLLKNASLSQRSRITVLLSERSITEYRLFYDRYIRGALRVDTAQALKSVLGSRAILVTGEHNDQLFGSDIMVPMIRRHGNGIIHSPFDRAILVEHFAGVLHNEALADGLVALLERLPAKAPMPITSLFEFVWWVNFSVKWQTVHMRMLTFTDAERQTDITASYVRDFYTPFYATEQFQLWSMNNIDKRIRDTWTSYKWPCKDIIFEFTRDAEYRDTKIKAGSLGTFVGGQRTFPVLESEYVLRPEFVIADYADAVNDFSALDRHISEV